MEISLEAAERAAEYYCAVRYLEDMDASEEEFDKFDYEFDLRRDEDEVLKFALESGLCDYFSADDIMSLPGVIDI